jgi:hypothetical protein
LFLCYTIPEFRRASGLRRYSRPCTLSTCRRLGLLDRKFRKSFGQDENPITESCGYSDAKHTHLCQGTSVVNSSHGLGNVFSSDIDLMEVSTIAYGTRSLTKLSEVQTWSSTSPRCTRLHIARSNYEESGFRTYLLFWTAKHSTRGRLHGRPTLSILDENPSSSATISPTQSDESISNVRSTIALEPARPVIPCRSERLSQPPERYSPGFFFTDTGEPTIYREEMKATDAASWRLAMESEMNFIRANETWDLVELL